MTASLLRHPPKPGYPLIGIIPQMQRDPLGALLQVMRSHPGEPINIGLGRVLLTDPDHVGHVLQDNHLNYKRGISDPRVATLLGTSSLVTLEGDEWRQQRRMMQPAFHRRMVESYAAIMTSATEEMLRTWSNETRDIAADMSRLTLRIIVQTMFGMDVDEHVTLRVAEAMATIVKHINFVVSLPLWMPTRRNRAFRQAVQTLDQIVVEMIQRHNQQHDAADNLITQLLQTDDEAGQRMTASMVRDELLTIFVAGHETTSNTLTWTWYLLTQHPDIDERMRSEIATVVGNRTPTYEIHMPSLPYTHMVLEESLRIYPSAWLFPRSPLQDDVVGGYHLPAGSMVLLSPYLTHRLPTHWPDPERFDPERFRPDLAAHRHRFAYYPFGGGPRLCIGNAFALTEAHLILTMVAQRVRLRAVPNHQVDLHALAAALRPRGGTLPMLVQPHKRP